MCVSKGLFPTLSSPKSLQYIAVAELWCVPCMYLHTIYAQPLLCASTDYGVTSKACLSLKVVFFQKVRCVFQISKTNIPNHHLELEIWISYGREIQISSSGFGIFFWRFDKQIALSEKKLPFKKQKKNFKSLFFSGYDWSARFSNFVMQIFFNSSGILQFLNSNLGIP